MELRNIVAPGSFRVKLGQRVRKTICGNNDAVRKREGVIVEQSPDHHVHLHPASPPANPGLLGASLLTWTGRCVSRNQNRSVSEAACRSLITLAPRQLMACERPRESINVLFDVPASDTLLRGIFCGPPLASAALGNATLESTVHIQITGAYGSSVVAKITGAVLPLVGAKHYVISTSTVLAINAD